jgi:hypothetical protein
MAVRHVSECSLGGGRPIATTPRRRRVRHRSQTCPQERPTFAPGMAQRPCSGGDIDDHCEGGPQRTGPMVVFQTRRTRTWALGKNMSFRCFAYALPLGLLSWTAIILCVAASAHY